MSKFGLSQMDKIEDNRAELMKLYHREGLEAAEASTRLLCCHSLLNDEESTKNDWYIFKTYLASSSSQL